MDTKDSIINRQMGRTIAGERAQIVGMTAAQLSQRSGIPIGTLNRILSKDPRDINITQITWIAAALNTTPQELVAEAVKRVGGLDAIMAEMREAIAAEMSEDAATNDEMDRKRRQKEAASMTTEQLEGEERRAATTNAELDSDEPQAP